jgi:hypothetical protein
MPGIKSISGAMNVANGRQMVFKTYKKRAVDGTTKTETRLYMMDRKERKTPLSENEMKARLRFKQATDYYNTLEEWQRAEYHHQWRADKYIYNGKKYGTLRGYIIARFYNGDLIVNCENLALPNNRAL